MCRDVFDKKPQLIRTPVFERLFDVIQPTFKKRSYLTYDIWKLVVMVVENYDLLLKKHEPLLTITSNVDKKRIFNISLCIFGNIMLS